jgi:nicotinate phosphoribosyltransferase
MSPSAAELPKFTDKYFLKTREIVGRNGDIDVTYAVFMRRPVVFTPRLAVGWLHEMAAARGTHFVIDTLYQEGDWVGAGEPLMYLSGSLEHLVDLETVFLQKLGPPCVAAFNAFLMCTDLPYVAFIAMDARHCAGAEMADMMAYAASVGSAKAQRDTGAKGFIGNATDATAHYFGNERGLGTMPHALIGYAGSTLRAAQMFHETFPNDNLFVLVDFFGREVSDSLEVCRAYPELAMILTRSKPASSS